MHFNFAIHAKKYFSRMNCRKLLAHIKFRVDEVVLLNYIIVNVSLSVSVGLRTYYKNKRAKF